jgi:glutathione S-transferase
MLRLYDYLPSQNAWKVRLLLSHLGVEYERVPVSIFEGESHTDAYLEKNPAGAVPVLEIEPGRFVAESNAILCYLAEGTRYLPTDRFERAQVMQWLFFEQSYVEPQIGSLRYWTLTGKLAKRSADMVEGKRAYSLRALAALERHLARRAFLESDSSGLNRREDSQATGILIQYAGWTGGQHGCRRPIPLTCASERYRE